MKFIIRGLCSLFASIFVDSIFALGSLSKKAEAGKVHLPKFSAIFGLIFFLCFSTVCVVMAVLKEPLWVCLAFLAISLLGILLIVAYINCRISYDENGFVSKNFFGIKRSFTYDQVTAIKEGVREDHCVYLGKSKVTVDILSIGGRDFLAHIKKQYGMLHNGQAVPQAVRSKNDLFRGHVEDPTGMIVAYVAMFLLILGVGAATTWYIYAPATTDNVETKHASFRSFSKSDKDLILTTTDGQIFKIRFADASIDSEKIKAVCDGKTVLTVYSEKVTPKHEEDYHSVKAIVYNDTHLLTFEDTNRLHIKEYRPLLFFVGGFLVLWSIFVLGSIIVGRNPQKYGKKIVGLFFKDGYVKY